MKRRLNWLDSSRGFGIFLVIYAHNYPIVENYIYSFHIPLFFFISGLFHPNKISKTKVLSRFKSLLIPYFVFSLFLYAFWYLLGRHYGNSLNYDLDPLKNFIGIFYAQGDMSFMDWGIPMWFLPCVFISFLVFGLVRLLKNRNLQYFILVLLILIGFLYPKCFDFKLPWSIDVALVSLTFYGTANLFKEKWMNMGAKNSKALIFLVLMIVISLVFSLLNSKIDMYRSIYGNEILFIASGLAGTLMVLQFFKILKSTKILAFLGKNTIPLLAFQLRALTFIKLVLITFSITSFEFDELTKLILTLVQIIIIVPIIVLINKYIPILNGKLKN